MIYRKSSPRAKTNRPNQLLDRQTPYNELAQGTFGFPVGAHLATWQSFCSPNHPKLPLSKVPARHRHHCHHHGHHHLCWLQAPRFLLKMESFPKILAGQGVRRLKIVHDHDRDGRGIMFFMDNFYGMN